MGMYQSRLLHRTWSNRHTHLNFGEEKQQRNYLTLILHLKMGNEFQMKEISGGFLLESWHHNHALNIPLFELSSKRFVYQSQLSQERETLYSGEREGGDLTRNCHSSHIGKPNTRCTCSIPRWCCREQEFVRMSVPQISRTCVSATGVPLLAQTVTLLKFWPQSPKKTLVDQHTHP